VIDDTPPRDPTEGLEKRIAVARSEATRIQVGYERAMLRTGELAEQVMIKLEREHKAKLEEIATLEQELIAIKAATPSSEAQNMMRTVLDQALAGDVPARQIIAEALPSLIISVICRKDGWLRVKSATSPLAWSVRLTAAHLSQPRSWCGSHMT
jgi:hypothetical protein